MSFTLEEARKLDAEDALGRFRSRFYIQENHIYLDGNSLGLLSKDAEAVILKSIDDWKRLAIHGWTEAEEPWFTLPEQLGEWTSPLIGALPNEVIVTGTTTVNLHNMLATFYKPAGNRTKIVADKENFPSDLYAIASHLSIHGRPYDDLILIEPGENGEFQTADIVKHFTDEVALVLLPSVWYKSGQLADIAALTQAAHQRGIVIGFDCAHSIGSVPHQLHDDGVDFAVWCNYKYLNGGPGATAGLYVHTKHHTRSPGLAGWFSSAKEKQFDMAFPLQPAHTAGQWQVSTPGIFSTVAVGASLRMFKEAGMDSLRSKSLKQTKFLRNLLEDQIIGQGLGGKILTPSEDTRRGGHIAFYHPKATQVCKALRKAHVTPDYRPGDIIRLAPIALYTSYEDVYRGVEILRRILETKEYENYEAGRDVVS